MSVSGPSAADADAMGVELFIYAWCDRDEAIRWSLLFAERARDEWQAVQARRARGEHNSALWDEVTRLNGWCWLARECAGCKLPAASGLYGSR